MRRPAAVALVTLREGLRARTLQALLAIFAGSLALTALLAGDAAPEERFRALLSSAGRDAHLLLLLASLATGALAYPTELRRRTLQHLFSKPLGRGAYLAGKWLGLCGVLLALCLGLCAIACAALAVAVGPDGERVVRSPFPLEAAGTDGGTWRFSPPARQGPVTLEIRLLMASPPPSLQAEVRAGDAPARSVTVGINARGEGQALLGPLPPCPSVTVRLPQASGPVAPGGIRLLAASRAYPLLIVETLLGDWLQAAALCAVALGASTFLSGPVALFLAVGFAALSHGHPLLTDLERLLLRSPVRAADAPQATRPPPASAPAVRWALGGLRTATPDLSAVDLCPSLDRAELPAPGALARVLAACLPHALASLALGWACLARREIGG